MGSFKAGGYVAKFDCKLLVNFPYVIQNQVSINSERYWKATEMFINKPTLEDALQNLYGTAGHMLKIWFVLKHMGLYVGSEPVEIDTANSTPSLKRLFSCGDSDGRFYIPFAHTPRYLVIKSDASRSIIQTNIQRWASSGSVVTCDPTEFLDFSTLDGKLKVSTGRRYPLGLGIGESGFALEEGKRVCLPITSFAVWYGRQTNIPDREDAATFLINDMLTELNISPAERELLFVNDGMGIATQLSPLSDTEIFSACSSFLDGAQETSTEVHSEDFESYSRRLKSMVTGLDLPAWMRASPNTEVSSLIDGGAKAILLFGPPRTGKTRFIDSHISREDPTRCTIQIHDGWGYDHLVEGLKPDSDGNWNWKDGPLKKAIQEGKKIIVLEEINRTAFTQALGEVFSLIEDDYRGEQNGLTLRSGNKFFIPEDVVFLMTMNTIDKSTEDIDDALLGRVAAIEFPPRAEDLVEMLGAKGIEDELKVKLAQLFSQIQTIYPLGHGYFSGLNKKSTAKTIIQYYKARVRPVLTNFLGELKSQELAMIDNLVDEMFSVE